MKKNRKKTLLLVICLAAAVVAVGIFSYKLMNARNVQLFGGIVDHIETQEKVVALTFDDGPTQKVDEILEKLDAYNVKGTFFLIGSDIEKYPGEAKKLASDGQEIGNHTYSHSKMIFKTYSYVKDEIEKTDALIREAGYNGPIAFRPPNCKKLVILPYYLNKTEKTTVTFNIEPNSYPEVNQSAQNIATYVEQNVQPGSIILLHPMYDSGAASIEAIPLIIQALQAKGYTFVTVSEMLAMAQSAV